MTDAWDANQVAFESESLMCNQHKNEEAIIIKLDYHLPFPSVVKCQNCLDQEGKIPIKTLNVDVAKEQIITQTKLFLVNLKEISEQHIRMVEQLEQMIRDLGNSLTKHINVILQNLDQWKLDLHNVGKKYLKINFETELKEYFQRAFKQKEVDDIATINKNHLCKLKKPFMDIMKFDECRRFYEKIIDLQDKMDGWKKIQIEKRLQPITVSLMSQYPIKKIVNQLEFYQRRLVACCDKNIQFFRLDKNALIPEQQLLIAHKFQIKCFAISQINDWIALADQNSNIFTLKFSNDKLWKSVKAVASHQGQITGMFLNKEENYLFTYGQDSKIFVWRVNQQVNTIEIQDQLDANGIILSVILNEQENQLISSNEKKIICLWSKGIEDGIWRVSSQLNIEEISYRVCFISCNQFIVSQSQSGISIIFEIVDDLGSKQQPATKPKKIIKLTQFSLNDVSKDEPSFQTIYHQKKNIIIQKHNQIVYVIKFNVNGTYNVKHKIDLQSNLISGALSKDGHHLVLWGNNNYKDLLVYKITYE